MTQINVRAGIARVSVRTRHTAVAVPGASSVVRAAVAVTAAFTIVASTTRTLAAQSASASSRASSAATQKSITGVYTGTASIQLGDSTLTVPVMYTFTAAGNTTGGTAMVPGQGAGAISNFVREGARVRFRVTATPATVAKASNGAAQPVQPSLLEHDGTVAADGTIEGMVQLNAQPVAKFKIAPKK